MDCISSSPLIPEDFWKPVPSPEIRSVEDCFSKEVLSLSPRVVKSFPEFIQKYMDQSIHIGCSGNGFCFLNACLGLLVKICNDYSKFPYLMFQDPYKDFLIKSGEENVENPDMLDTDKASNAFRYFMIFELQITNIALLILYSDGTYKFSPELDEKGNPYNSPNHIFILFLDSGHFTAISIDKALEYDLYTELVRAEKFHDGTPSEPTLEDVQEMFRAISL
jgi:hypothetical protein